MIQDVSDTVASGSLLLAIPIAVLAGLISFFSPCVVPLLPGYLSYVTGVGVQDLDTARRGRLLLGSSLFVLGFTVVFVSGGALFGSIGQELFAYHRELSIVTGVLVILLGL
ncbi:cytochrome c biogenesis CcdA family protein, partial [Aeromicrobium sp.]|uniref:cytochrome c biogenesis CcdA family protein n=1 Tax=Aeromicrobium sp. TaxID=1871063 RepID=UPI003D6C38AF